MRAIRIRYIAAAVFCMFLFWYGSQTPGADERFGEHTHTVPAPQKEPSSSKSTASLLITYYPETTSPHSFPDTPSTPEPPSAHEFTSSSEAFENSLRLKNRPGSELEETEYVLPLPRYKKLGVGEPPRPIQDNFPLAAAAHSPDDLPPIPSWNMPPQPHVPEKTPLLIGFTRNWRLLQQTIVGYITAGWPPEDIYVFENTGVMDNNRLRKLSLQNPFFLNHTRLELLGVNVIVTPTIFSFAQLQNLFTWTAIQNDWPYYFWSHMDVIPLSFEEGLWNVTQPSMGAQYDTGSADFKSLYKLAVETLRATTAADWAPDEDHLYDNSRGPSEHWADRIKQPPKEEQFTSQRWAARFFQYDWLTLVQTKAFEEIGGWDTNIPYYGADCDFHERLLMQGFSLTDAVVGHIFDTATSLDDLEVLYRKRSADGTVKYATSLDLLKLIEKNGEPDIEEEIDDEKPISPIAAHMAHTAFKGARPDDDVEISESREEDELDLPIYHRRSTWPEDDRNSTAYAKLVSLATEMGFVKFNSKHGRNTWQIHQRGGQGDPYYRDALGFEQGMQMAIAFGRSVFREKWGHKQCDLLNAGLGPGDAWRVKHDW